MAALSKSAIRRLIHRLLPVLTRVETGTLLEAVTFWVSARVTTWLVPAGLGVVAVVLRVGVGDGLLAVGVWVALVVAVAVADGLLVTGTVVVAWVVGAGAGVVCVVAAGAGVVVEVEGVSTVVS